MNPRTATLLWVSGAYGPATAELQAVGTLPSGPWRELDPALFTSEGKGVA